MHDPIRSSLPSSSFLTQNAGYMESGDTKLQLQFRTQWARPKRMQDKNSRPKSGSFTRNSRTGTVKEFRIVKDNRVKNKADEEAQPKTVQNPDFGNGQVMSNKQVKSSSGNLANQRHPTPSAISQPINPLPKESTLEICSSSSDPIHVPSPDFKSPGTVGSRCHHIGVVGLRKQTIFSDGLVQSEPNLKNLFPILSSGNGSVSSSEQPRHLIVGSKMKNGQVSQPQPSDTTLSVPTQCYHGRMSHQSASHHKAQHTYKEWRPKTSQSPHVAIAMSVHTALALPCTVADSSSSSSSSSSSTCQNNHITDLSEDLSHANFFEDDVRVIIPEHLRVPDSKRLHLIFGTFDAQRDSKELISLAVMSNLSESSEKLSCAVEQVEDLESQVRASDFDLPLLSDMDGPQSTGGYVNRTVGLVMATNHETSHQYNSSVPHDLQDGNPDLQSFKDYDPDSRYGVHFLGSDGEHNKTAHDSLALANQEMSAGPINTSQIPSTATPSTPNHYQHHHQQQLHVPQLYPHVHLPHFPNYLPYRHVFSPVYVPPPVPGILNYSTSPTYAASSYLLMAPNGNSHLPAGALKYSASQYKPVFTGGHTAYGSYSNLTNGCSVGPGVIRPAGPTDDASRLKYKDSSLYVPNPQAPRELPNTQSAPFYNIPAQLPATHAAACLPNPTAHALFNAAPQPSPVQYPGLPPTAQPGTMILMPGQHNLVRQPVQPGLGANMGVGVAAQASPFPQNHQLGHFTWTANF